MQLVESPAFSPGQCFIMGSAKGPFIDTERDLGDMPGHGRLYICEAAVITMAQAVGYVPRRMVDEAVAELEAANLRIKELEGEMTSLQHVRDAIESFGAATSTTEPPAPVEPVVEVDTDLLDILTEGDPPPDGVGAIMAWINESEDAEQEQTRRQIAVHVESRKSENQRRVRVMSLLQGEPQ